MYVDTHSHWLKLLFIEQWTVTLVNPHHDRQERGHPLSQRYHITDFPFSAVIKLPVFLVQHKLIQYYFFSRWRLLAMALIIG